MSTTTYPIHIPSELHPATAKLVARFAEALSEKLAAAERKYGYSDGWAEPNWMNECRAKLIEHVQKGDPRDVAAYCAFLWHHGESTAAGVAAEPPGLTDDQIQVAVFAVLRRWNDDRAWDRYTRESGPYDVTSLRPEVLEIIRAVLAVARGVKGEGNG